MTDIDFRTDYGTIHGSASGPLDGELIVALHSLGMSGALWDLVAAQLAKAEYRVIAVDARGHGRSSAAPLKGARDWVEDLRTVVGTLRRDQPVTGGVHLLGASMGSLQALEFALHDSDRVRSLLLASGFGHMDKELAAAKTKKLTEGPAAVGMPAWGARYASEALVTDDPAIHELVRTTVGSTSLNAYTDAVRACYEPRSGPIGSIDVPALVLWGEEDTKTPAELSEALTADLKNAEMKRIPAGGHLCMLDAPERFADEVARFLQQQVTVRDDD